ncbi:MAG: hypothetical protein P8J86_04250 [Phycisphaerales bacterium]|nr:hypothetical protein [Phycisphaerales bacterium]
MKLWSSAFPNRPQRVDGNKLPKRGPSSYHGISLIEVLLALGLLLIVASIGVVSSTALLNQQSFDSSLDTIREQLKLAQLHAKRTSKMIEVVYEPGTNSIVANVLELTDENSAVQDDLGLQQKRWAHNQLNTGLSLAKSLAEPSAFIEFEEILDGQDMIANPLVDGKWPLLVFLPSGGCAHFDPVYLRDNQGRLAKLSIEPLTGHVTWARLDQAVSDDSGFDDSRDSDLEIASADELRLPELPAAQESQGPRLDVDLVYP